MSRQTGFSDQTREALQMAPYLNGNLFKEKPDYDNIGLWIPDEEIEAFFEFLFRHNFTVEENTYYDQELELNPEFLGIIFEKLVNKEDGAVYTPRTEVDFMCRMGLVKWLQKNTSSSTRDLYHLFFRERGRGDDYDDDQKQGDFTPNEISELVEKLENVTVCDPAAGSGAFEVGMLYVLKEILENLCNRSNAPADLTSKSGYELKKSIIARSLYGVEVKQWAVWINHLRLWLTLFIDMPDDEKMSMKPLLPSLNFKVRCGDSLVQRIGSKLFPVQGHADLSTNMKRKVTKLKNTKTAYFNNRGVSEDEVTHQEFTLFRDIIREELDDKRKQLNRIELIEKKASQTEQGNLDLGGLKNEDSQQKIAFDEEKKEALRQEIIELEEQENNLAEDHPLIWNIEFAEIFVEKGGFDIIIGNPPYVDNSDIGDPLEDLSAKKYKEYLKEIIRQDFPEYFQRPSRTIDGRSNLYVYFYLRSIKLLNGRGTHIFICQNSWLDVGYGVWFQKFILDSIKVDYIIDNQVKRSFSNAGVNTVITFMNAPVQKISQKTNYKFVAFKRPFEETVLTENLLEIESTMSWVENDSYRLFPKKVEELIYEGTNTNSEGGELSLSSGYTGNKWGGRYLRMPKYFYDLLEEKEKYLVPFKNEIEINYGVKSGKVKFFYIDEDTINTFGIERDYYQPIIKSSKSLATINVERDAYIFSSKKTRRELKGTGALDYIEWAEGEGLNKGSSVQSHKPFWYSLNLKEIDNLFFQFFNERFFTPIVDSDTTCSNNFCYGIFKGNDAIGKAFVNSTFYFLQVECFGRVNQGEGVLNIYKDYDYPFIRLVDFDLLDEKVMKKRLEKISERKVGTVFSECGIDPSSDIPIMEQEPNPKRDREELDNEIFDAINLSKETRKDIYRSLCKLVRDRLSKSESV